MRRAEIDQLTEQLNELAPRGYSIGLHIRFASPIMSFHSYDPAWVEEYTDKAYFLRDPTVAWGISRSGATRWSAIPLPDPFGIMRKCKKYGLNFGVTISCGKVSSRTLAGFAHDQREFTDDEIARLSELVMRLHNLVQPPEKLTKSEIEALQVLASGQRYAQGAAALGISESALKARLSSARGKLFARTSAEAIQRAMDYRLL